MRPPCGRRSRRLFAAPHRHPLFQFVQLPGGPEDSGGILREDVHGGPRACPKQLSNAYLVTVCRALQLKEGVAMTRTYTEIEPNNRFW